MPTLAPPDPRDPNYITNFQAIQTCKTINTKIELCRNKIDLADKALPVAITFAVLLTLAFVCLILFMSAFTLFCVKERRRKRRHKRRVARKKRRAQKALIIATTKKEAGEIDLDDLAMHTAAFPDDANKQPPIGGLPVAASTGTAVAPTGGRMKRVLVPGASGEDDEDSESEKSKRKRQKRGRFGKALAGFLDGKDEVSNKDVKNVKDDGKGSKDGKVSNEKVSNDGKVSADGKVSKDGSKDGVNDGNAGKDKIDKEQDEPKPKPKGVAGFLAQQMRMLTNLADVDDDAEDGKNAPEGTQKEGKDGQDGEGQGEKTGEDQLISNSFRAPGAYIANRSQYAQPK